MDSSLFSKFSFYQFFGNASIKRGLELAIYQQQETILLRQIEVSETHNFHSKFTSK